MQTRTPSFHSVSSTAKRVCAALCIGLVLSSLTACSVPRIAGKAEAEQQQSPCEKAYLDAAKNNTIAHDQRQPSIRRYLAARQAVSAWTDTAAYCPSRFADGTLRSAQARHIANILSDRISVDVKPTALSRFDGIESLDVDSASLATMAQAEDEAGFAMALFAARSIGHATLDISDRHKTTAQRLVSFSGTADKRKKVYDTTNLIANPDTIVDSATGLAAPTDAVIEMNCARSEITTIENSSNAAQSQSPNSREQSLGVLAGLIADRIESALDWGYPSFDEALFEQNEQ